MGQRSNTETVVAVVQAFLQVRSWKQASLADHVGVGVPALRKRLHELEAQGFPLTREEDHPDVWWSVPKDWFPGGVAFGSDDVPELLRQLYRLPKSVARDRFIRRLIATSPRQTELARNAGPTLVTAAVTESEETYLPLAEDAAARRVPLAFKYFTASRGAVEWRHASIQRITIGPPARFLAVCHRDAGLKWFRLDNVLGAHLDETIAYRPADTAAVGKVLAESLDGFHHGGAAVRCAFVVREPESRWVANNLPGAMTGDAVPGGTRFSATTAGVLRLARFVVGLGSAARVETAELALLVKELAEGALGACSESATSPTQRTPTQD